MFIPKGSLVFPNVLATSLDEDYVDPTAFSPSRFMPKSSGGGGESPFTLAFGFGRRMCPGRHLAYASLWIAIAAIFSTLHISRKKDQDGYDIPLHLEFGSNITKCATLPTH
ncbi:cytochrome P450 [Pleurotus eryngii]|uniref:Cytochrome P450 n=1 Tax=Pleurotus eryngii TaxID=5323 RepID=A0A9P6A1U5_PLEER|nr:cytochrome P450 [Pleurotus eryngii]